MEHEIISEYAKKTCVKHTLTLSVVPTLCTLKKLNEIYFYSGGVQMFSADENAVLKWYLNRPEQSKNTSALTPSMEPTLTR